MGKEKINVTNELSNSMTKLNVYANVFKNYAYSVDMNNIEIQEFLIAYSLDISNVSENLMSILNELDEQNDEKNKGLL